MANTDTNVGGVNVIIPQITMNGYSYADFLSQIISL